VPSVRRGARQREALEDTACIRGNCPCRADPVTVCPSGFWGFRHRLGLPLSIAPEEFSETDAKASAIEITYDGRPELSVAVSPDPQFTLRQAHEEALRRLEPSPRWHYADTRAETIALLREQRAHVIYFYCHGGTVNNIAYIQVGSREESGITPEALRAYGIRWLDVRPLVFINGCHTTALEPAQAINFVSALIENAAAAGVIGTEITNFESLAGTFAEECLQRFLAGTELGEAVRQARLALLRRGNPLGLIFIPFALPSLRLMRQR
jgi:CHAT domain